MTYDHKHRHVSDKGVPYEFKDIQQLINNFFADAERVLRKYRDDESDFD
uniref:Uncharacterized protein n=1 Tax=Candidatus Nitrotoga fabula TaxID=2182327 RepID=A0A2X0QUA3_9PROT|nr:conserved protein of unknown function [Candidatus Nitrotoga fabula]